MGMMMLDPDPGHRFRKTADGKPGAHIFRMQIMGHHLWLNIQNGFEMIQGLNIKISGFLIFQIPDVLT